MCSAGRFLPLLPLWDPSWGHLRKVDEKDFRVYRFQVDGYLGKILGDYGTSQTPAVPARPGCLCLFFELHLTPAPASFKMLHRKVTRSSSSHTCANPDSWFTILSSCQQRCLCPVLLPFPKQSFPFVSSFLVFPVNFVLFCFFFFVCVCVALPKCLPSLLWSDSCYRRWGNFCPNRWGMTSIYFYATFFTNLFEWKQKTLV